MARELIFLFAGIAIGAFTAWFISRLKYDKYKTALNQESDLLQKNLDACILDKKIAEERIHALQEERESDKSNISKKENMIIDLTSQLSEKNADCNHLSLSLQKQHEEMIYLQNIFREEFKNLANEILEEKTHKFTQQNRDNLYEILHPLNEKIKEFEHKVEETYRIESKERFSLQNEIKNLLELNHRLGTEANNLTRALKGDVKTLGNWGEMILENILERSGLEKNREYFVQNVYADESGKKLQPDVVVIYPAKKCIVIDSKVSLISYERYCSTDDNSQKTMAIKEHLHSIKKHIDGLSAKKYQDILQINSPDFVIMFMPVEPAYLLALQNDPTLWNYAYEKRVMMISPTNLIAILKMIECLWRYEYQNKNAEEIARQSGALYDKFVGFIDDLTKLGKKLESAHEDYQNAMKKLCEGKGNLIKRSEEIKKLGAQTSKSMPDNALFPEF